MLVAVTSYGLLASDPYRLSVEVTAQGRGQDLLTLLAVPALVWSAARARAGSLRAHLLWLGIVLYLAYSYVTYAFSVPFNDAFLGYVAVLGLSSYGLLNGLLGIDVDAVAPAFAATPRRVTAWSLALTGAAFGLLWLSDILSAFPGGLPTNRFVYDLPNPIHVIDLAWLIPLVMATAVLLWREYPAGPVLAAVLLVKLLTLGLALLSMVVFMLAAGNGLESSDVPVVVLAVTMTVLATTLLAVGARRMRRVTGAWMRASRWR
ncbi:hypothetical protein ACQEVZ_02375 [Dactylosporangium sp. CA-152071]|uniref:hypothetical protein n=1 Tax=Dactylosporangium sp. CA-152071 TaxID=3239933 RepID=UPI003D8F2D4E